MRPTRTILTTVGILITLASGGCRSAFVASREPDATHPPAVVNAPAKPTPATTSRENPDPVPHVDSEVQPVSLEGIRQTDQFARADALPTVEQQNEPAPETPPPATVFPRPDDPLAQVRQVLERSEIFNNQHPDFVCRLTRTERTTREPELMLLRFRKEPRSVYLTWLDQANEGRACLYVDGQYRGKMISRGGRGDLLLAGRTLWLDPHGALARSKSTMSITETGLDHICSKIRRRLDLLTQNDASEGTLAYESGSDPDAPDHEYDWIIHDSPRSVDHDLPDGGQHRYGFRRDNGRLEVVRAIGPRDQLVYRYLFDRYIPVTNFTDEDFSADTHFPRKEASAPLSPAEQTVLADDSPQHQ